MRSQKPLQESQIFIAIPSHLPYRPRKGAPMDGMFQRFNPLLRHHFFEPEAVSAPQDLASLLYPHTLVGHECQRWKEN